MVNLAGLFCHRPSALDMLRLGPRDAMPKPLFQFSKPFSHLGAQAAPVRAQVINPLVRISAKIVDALVVGYAGDVNRDP
jgi:hypothetical protein